MKDTYVKLRVNKIEKSLLETNAKRLDITLSDYIRLCCLTYPPKILKRKLGNIEEIVIKQS